MPVSILAVMVEMRVCLEELVADNDLAVAVDNEAAAAVDNKAAAADV